MLGLLVLGCGATPDESVGTEQLAADLSELQNVESYVPTPTEGVPFDFVQRLSPPVLKRSGGATLALIEDGLALTCGHEEPWLVKANVQLSPTGVQRPFYYYDVAEQVEEIHRFGPDELPVDHRIVRLFFPAEYRWGAAQMLPEAPELGDIVVQIGHPGWAENPLGDPNGEDYKAVDTGHVTMVDLTPSSHSIGMDDVASAGGASGAPIFAYPDGRIIGIRKGVGGVSLELTAQASAIIDGTRGSGAMFNVSGSSKTKLSSMTGWSQTWRHIVPGRFDSDTFDDLFFYDGQNGQGRFYRVTSNGTISPLGNMITGMRRNWSQIVPLNWDDSGMSELFFYDAATGRGELYRTDGAGKLTQIMQSASFGAKNCRQVVAGDLLNQAGPELVLYCPAVQDDGEDLTVAVVYKRTSTGYSLAFSTQLSGYYSIAVVGEFHTTGPRQEIMFYDPTENIVRFYKLNELRGFDLLAEQSITPGGSRVFTQIAPGDFTTASGTELLFYDPGVSIVNDERFPSEMPSQTRWFSVSQGQLTQRGSKAEPHTLSRLVAGKFMSNSRYQVLQYDRFRDCLGSSAPSHCFN